MEGADLSPSRYIARIGIASGQEIPGPIDPEELLVHSNRDKHPLEIGLQCLASAALRLTKNEAAVRGSLRTVNALGVRVAAAVGAATGSRTAETVAKKMMGVVEREAVFRFREPTQLSERELRERVTRLRREARFVLGRRGARGGLHVLLTGATGFLGKEILAQAARERGIERVDALVRPQPIRDPKTKEVVRVLSPRERGALLLKRLHIHGPEARKFRFVAGDIEKPGLGIGRAERADLERSLTHVIHCAASVSFDDSYEASYRSNVLGCLNALAFSLAVQRARGSRFVSHVAIETSYIHGRKQRSIAQEAALVFPRHFYNNFYELTKAFASIETDRFLVEKGLRVVQLLPAIVVGHSRTGNNRGDTKVVNAPINAFGRAKEMAALLGKGGLLGWPKAWLISALANAFPGDPSAELNLVPLDRVATGILAALAKPEAVGSRIHLATDNRIRGEEMVRITREELGANVRLTDPTLFRNLTLPVAKAVLLRMKEPKLAAVLEKLASIFGGYGEWGQPIHEVGNDVRILGLPLRRPDTRMAFRMLCRHNKYVQAFGSVRDPDEIARRERLWEEALEAIEFRSGREAASLGAEEFRAELAVELDPRTFRRRRGAKAARSKR